VEIVAGVSSAERARDARRSVLLTAGTVALFLVYATLVHLLLPAHFDLLGPVLSHFSDGRASSPSMDLPRLLAVLGVLLVVNVVLAATARWWPRYRHAALAYAAFHAAMLTLALHYVAAPLGLFLVYGFVVVHPAVLRSRAACFVTANLCAALYTLLVLADRAQLAPALRLLPDGIQNAAAAQQVVYVSMAFLTLNCLAAFAAYYGGRMRHFAASLRVQVEARTSELRAAHDDLAAAHAELQAVVYAVTHDVKTPLGSIGLIGRLLLEGGGLSAAARSDVERIVRLQDAAERLILDLLGFFRATAREEPCSWVNLREVVERTAEGLRPALQAKGLAIEVGARLPEVWAQPAKLEHVVWNLLGNAVKYTPPSGGTITVGGHNGNGTVVFWVEDRGIGIAPQHHAQIFELFGRVRPASRGEDAVEGSGVGLAIVKRVVEGHGGSVAVRSRPKHGSVFEVRLPCPRREGES